MKNLILIICCLFVLGGCVTSSGSGNSGERENASKLIPSPCAGCFGTDEKERLNIENEHVS